ncbi:hypothetical protein B0H19DRAFT_1262128 [Mycena capillaripes]|nr:hypothetical protein B0H19DRAFT_1262128 [Mycena capillaripes]
MPTKDTQDTVDLAARSPEKAAAAIKRQDEETGKRAIFPQLDLADLPSVRKSAETFLSQESRLDILFDNGGVMITTPGILTAQKHDLRTDNPSFPSQSRLTTLLNAHPQNSARTLSATSSLRSSCLLPALTKSYEETEIPARVPHTSSAGHIFAPGNGIDFQSLKDGPERDVWVKNTGIFRGPWALYDESKIGKIFISNYFAKTHSDVLLSCALHPGGIKTELQRYTLCLLYMPPSLTCVFPRHSAGWIKVPANALLYPVP